MPRPKVHDEALRVRLLEAAVRALSEEGPDALSLRRLAARVDTSTTAVYSLFGGKPGLLEAVYDEAFARFGQRLAEVVLTGDPLGDLRALGEAYRASALAEPHFYQVMFGSLGAAITPGPQARQRAEATFQPLVDGVRRAMDAGVLRREDPVTVASAMWAAAHGLVSLELRALLPMGAAPTEEVYRRSMTAMGLGWSVAAQVR
jgi:AcrR family transcriptional regulator